jgi:hypothetical protein
MTQPFAPQEHLIKIPRRVKTASDAWETVYDDYLEVKFRLVMFREKYPHGRITTEEVCVDLDRGYARFKATIEDGEGGLATGYGTETKAGFADYCERSETRALGRALAVMGFGTQFVGSDMSEGEHIVDAPVTSAAIDAPDAAPETTTGRSLPLPVGEDGTAGAPTTPAPKADEGLAHPTESHLAALRNLAVTECQEPLEVYEDRIRTTMKIPKQASVAPKLLTRTMSMPAYMDVFAYYRRLEAQLAKGKETPGANDSADASTPKPEPAPTEAPQAVPAPAAASSAPEPDPADAAERDRVRLRAEVATWPLTVKAEEAEYIITHHPYSKARTLLWQVRRQETAA